MYIPGEEQRPLAGHQPAYSLQTADHCPARPIGQSRRGSLFVVVGLALGLAKGNKTKLKIQVDAITTQNFFNGGPQLSDSSHDRGTAEDEDKRNLMRLSKIV